MAPRNRTNRPAFMSLRHNRMVAARLGIRYGGSPVLQPELSSTPPAARTSDSQSPGNCIPRLFKQHYYLDLPAPVCCRIFCRIHRWRACRAFGRYTVIYCWSISGHAARGNARMAGHRRRYEVLVCRMRISPARAWSLRKETARIFPHLAPAAMRSAPALKALEADHGQSVRSE